MNPDNSSKISGYRQLMHDAYDMEKYDQMNKYAVKILSLDPEDSDAWYYRMQYWSEQDDSSYDANLIEAGRNAVKYAVEDQDDLKSTVNMIYLRWASTCLSGVIIMLDSFVRCYIEERSGIWELDEITVLLEKNNMNNYMELVKSVITVMKEVSVENFEYPFEEEDYMDRVNEMKKALPLLRRCYERLGLIDQKEKYLDEMEQDVDELAINNGKIK